jgi:hypothetical protein
MKPAMPHMLPGDDRLQSSARGAAVGGMSRTHGTRFYTFLVRAFGAPMSVTAAGWRREHTRGPLSVSTHPCLYHLHGYPARQANGHGVSATPENVSRCRHDHSITPALLPEGEGDSERAARDFHGNRQPRRPVGNCHWNEVNRLMRSGKQVGGRRSARWPQSRRCGLVLRLQMEIRTTGLRKQVAAASSRVASAMACHLGRTGVGRRGLLFGGFMDQSLFHFFEPQFELVNLRL